MDNKIYLKKILISLISFVLIICIFFCISVGIQKANATTTPNGGYIIVIDAGHGGIDGGVAGVKTKIAESEINLSVAKKLEQQFSSAGFTVVMTRTTNNGLYGVLSKGFKLRDLKKRIDTANKSNANVFISIHMNKFSDSKRRGAQVFIKNSDEESSRLGSFVQKYLDEVDFDYRDSEVKNGDYYILNNAKMPAILCECGFLSNPEDEELLISDEYQQKIAYSIFLGTFNYLYSGDAAFKVFER